MKFIISVFLSIIFACVPCFAYTADSFVIDTDPYVFSKVKSMSLASPAPVLSVSDLNLQSDNPSISFGDFTIDYLKFTVAGNYDDEDYVNPAPFLQNYVFYPTGSVSASGSYSFYSPYSINTSNIFQYGGAGLEVYLTYELPFEASSFSIDSNFYQNWWLDLFVSGSSTNYRTEGTPSDYFNIFVDGVEVGKVNLINGKFVSDFVYSQSAPINSISLRFWCPGTNTVVLPSVSDPTGGYINFITSADGFSISFMESNEIIDGSNDQAFSDINKHNQIESEWTGSMSQNFADLHLDTFSFPAGAASAFSLISGIFTDLWNSMGDFKIAYVFPLYLGIVLLLVGRLSKFSGGSSSSSKGKSDDNA